MTRRIAMVSDAAFYFGPYVDGTSRFAAGQLVAFAGGCP